MCSSPSAIAVLRILSCVLGVVVGLFLWQSHARTMTMVQDQLASDNGSMLAQLTRHD